MNFNTVPTYELPLTKGGTLQTPWYRFFQGLYQGLAPTAEVTITPGASPFPYTAPQKGFMIIRGGTVTAVQFTRTVTTLTGQISGIFPLNQGDILTISFSALPALTWVPV